MIAGLGVDGAFRQLPDLLCSLAMPLLLDHQVSREAVGEGADLTRRTAGGGLTGQRERSVAWLGDLAHQQMDIIDVAVDPHAAGMLVEAHGPVRCDLFLRVCKHLGQFHQLILGNTRELGRIVERIRLDCFGKLFEGDLGQLAAFACLLLLQRVLGTQAVANIGRRLVEIDMLVDELLVIGLVLDDVVGDVVGDRQVCLRLEDNAVVSQFKRAVGECRQHMHFTPLFGQAGIRQARPQDGVHLRHVGAPQDEDIRMFEVVIAAHGLVDAEGAHESANGGRHAVARVRIEIVGAQTCFHQLGSSVALPDGPLAGTEHADAGRPFLFERGFPFIRHGVHGLVPGDLCKFTLLVILAILLAQQRFGEAVLAIHDLGQEVALDAVEALVDRRIRITLGGDNLAILDANQHRTTGAAETACCLVPAHTIVRLVGGGIGDRDR